MSGRGSSANLTAYILLTLLLLWAAADHFAPYHARADAGCRVGYVYDGDTVEMVCDGEKRMARLLGFDTPETKAPKCAAEAAWGHRATLRLRELVKRPDTALYPQGLDKYRRTLVVMTVGGKDVAQIMVAEGLAVDYHGEARRDWCAGGSAGRR